MIRMKFHHSQTTVKPSVWHTIQVAPSVIIARSSQEAGAEYAQEAPRVHEEGGGVPPTLVLMSTYINK
jgi:hypothetical protein